jgi:hypothetical protein
VLVTVLCVWLGYQLNLIRQRNAVLERQHPAIKFVSGKRQQDVAFTPCSIRILRQRSAIGVLLKRGTDTAEREQIRKLFPEAEIYNLNLPGHRGDRRIISAQNASTKTKLPCLQSGKHLAPSHAKTK